MNADELGDFATRCVAELAQKQAALSGRHGLGQHERFEVDLVAGKLRFYDADGLALEAEVTPIGTHVPEKSSWQWAWANVSFPDDVRARAARVKELAERTEAAAFSARTLEVDEEQSWGLLAMACEHLGAVGAYTFPNRNARLYVAIDRITTAT
jgi:hypothetical protein